MRILILISTLLTLSQSTFADCSPNGLWLWPQTEEISPNSIFVLEGYAFSQKVILGLNFNTSAYLESDEERVELQVVRLNKGQYRITQVILKPIHTLKPGKTYQFHLENMEGSDSDEFFLDEKSYRISSSFDTETPVWQKEPELIYKNVEYYGCGPNKNAVFSTEFRDSSPTLVYAILVNKSSGGFSSYFLRSRDKRVEIGHGMCSGAFYFVEGENYEVAFSLLDASGNMNLNFTQPISFRAPGAKDEIDAFDFEIPEPQDSGLKLRNNWILAIGAFALTILLLVLLKFYYNSRKV